MNTDAFYHYLTRTRRALWATLRAMPDEQLSRAVIPTEGARCIKDLVMHIAVVEDGWFRGDLLGRPLVRETFGWKPPSSPDEYWHHPEKSLEELLTYWEAVEQDTLARWPELIEQAATDRRVAVDEVLWHVMQHEVRHTAQIVQMIRLLGDVPPALDLAFFAAR
ncbi:DUF664 domain-containing protein [Deinococcus metallilatus]|uniref:DUF664 domain-containing protein n=1 Tax=Deinococcus metallilatus TaxID=1211322 RepID=A0AAJ5F3Y9_9DEIO|nr:DinB family protein [Deinococcus metallilatus]MBB5295998.1 putative damage-inducible protein DinB [Deinococcus metallilatus]QBY08181.1 DUF664 domain-containing protein [Deinococcus metallilatus]RXJ11913.1 DUF664 domain-containing protein [Deinococcus metallilatus]TLK25855.1 DUF664 domain-containing protein [Deinococcus metallilatus]GMA14467.1 damage-inducible protein DinB [Deinococcus metallilatus]